MSYSPPNIDVKVSGSITVADTGSAVASGYANQSVITGTPTANSFLQLQIQTASSVTFAISGNLSGTLVFERSLDGVQWAQFGCFPANTPNTTTTVVSTGGTTGQGDFHGLLASHGYARIRCSAFTSGTATINIQASPSTGTVSVNSPIRIMAPDGTVTAVKTASTAPVATDNSLVTTTSPNSPDVSSLSTIATNTSNGATAARQDTGNTSLSTIATNTGRIPAQGAAATTASLPVNIASDQTVPVSNTNFATINTNTSRIPALGQVASTGSTPVVIATDQSPVSIRSGNFSQTDTFATTGTQNGTVYDLLTNGYRNVSVHITALGTAATVNFQTSGDNVTYVAQTLQVSSAALSTPGPSTAGLGVWSGAVFGRYFRIQITGQTAGTSTTISSFSTEPITHLSPGGQVLLNGTVSTTSNASASTTGLTSYQGTAVTALTTVKASAGRLHRIIIQNPNTSLAWLQVFNAATTGAVTLGTTAPLYSLPILASGVFEDFFQFSDTFSAGIVIAATTTPQGATAVTTGLVVSMGYI